MARKPKTPKAAAAAAIQITSDCERDEDGFGALALPILLHDSDAKSIERQQVAGFKARLIEHGFEALEVLCYADEPRRCPEWDPRNDGDVDVSDEWALVAVLKVADDEQEIVALFARPATPRQDWPFPKGKEGEGGPQVESEPQGLGENTWTPPGREAAPAPQRIPGRLQFVTPQLLTLRHINVRNESHGKAKVDAIDLDFQLEGMNADVLDLLQAGLCEHLYHNPEAESGQEPVPGVRQVLPKKRFPKLEQLPWSVELTGVDLTVIYGTARDESNIDFTDGKAVTKRAELKEGGTVLLFFRYSTCNIPDGAIDKLRKKLDQLVEVTMVQQEKLRQQVIDGTVGHPSAAAAAADPRDATDLFTEQHGGEPGDSAPDGGFDAAPDDGEREAAEEGAES